MGEILDVSDAGWSGSAAALAPVPGRPARSADADADADDGSNGALYGRNTAGMRYGNGSARAIRVRDASGRHSADGLRRPTEGNHARLGG